MANQTAKNNTEPKITVWRVRSGNVVRLSKDRVLEPGDIVKDRIPGHEHKLQRLELTSAEIQEMEIKAPKGRSLTNEEREKMDSSLFARAASLDRRAAQLNEKERRLKEESSELGKAFARLNSLEEQIEAKKRELETLTDEPFIERTEGDADAEQSDNDGESENSTETLPNSDADE